MTNTRTTLGWASLALLSLYPACGSDNAPAGEAPQEDAAATTDLGDDQTPPQGADSVQAWLKRGAYKNWQCEPDVHASRDPSPHGFNRICSNDLLSEGAAGKGAWPAGSAGVKELYASVDGTKPIGYAVYLKTEPDSKDGANWYWYEDVPADSAAPNGAQRVVADGLGDSGPAKTICVGCHAAAGIDAEHTPTVGARDQVYTPVR